MTLFGIDGSDFDWQRGPMDIAAMRRDGISWLTHKATEGTTVRHQHYGQVLTRARDAGVPVLGAYHVVRSVGALSAQVAWFLRYLDEATPWWRSHPNFFLQVDLERWPYDNVQPLTGTAFADQAAEASGKPVLIYASRGQYGNSLAGSRPLWNANYPTSRAGHYSDLYAAAGGDKGPGWSSYSGRVPVMWQYTSSATIGTQPGCDANAFRGSLADLLNLAGGQDMTPDQASQLAQVHAIVRAMRWAWQTDRAGFVKAGGDAAVWDYAGGIGDNTQAVQVQQLLASAASSAQREQDLLTALTALAQGGTSVDTAAILARIDQREADVHGQVAALQQQLVDAQARLAAALAAAGGALQQPAA